MNQQYRYPGAKPFQTSEGDIFYGRQEDIIELYQTLVIEPIVVLHAKSGLGKSSLINAGLAPRIKKEQEFTAFNIRFYAKKSEEISSPLSTTTKILNSQSSLLEKIKPKGENSLWYHLKSIQLGLREEQGILLIFDQFEELFTYDSGEIHQFAKELSEALHTTLPQRFREERRKGFAKTDNYLNTDELRLLDQPLKLRILFSIRSDRMSLLKSVKEYLPNILSTDYELKALDRIQAEDAILSPAYLVNGFSTPRFDFEDNAIEYLLNFLSRDGKENIESFQLQILCEYIEQKVVEKNKKNLVSIEDIENPEQILENYYLDKIDAITNPEDRFAVRKFIEEGLIFEDENRRLTVYEGQIQKGYGISATLLQQLLNTHIIRSEPSMRGGYTYELSHDTLVAPVLKAKSKRLEEERRITDEKERQEKEKETAELRAKVESERKHAEEQKKLRHVAEANEQKAAKRTKIAWIISFIGLGLAVFAGFQFFKANDVLSKLGIINAQTATRLIPEIDKHILDLDYDLVLEKANAALAYNGDKEKITKNLQELAYFYTESEQFEKTIDVLKVLEITPKESDKTTLLPLIQQLDKDHFESLVKRYYPEMVTVKGGTFKMGCTDNTECDTDEYPVHNVQLDDFEMAATETTWWQFALYCASTKKDINDFSSTQGNKAADNIDWYEAIEYSNWLSEQMEIESAYDIDTTKVDPGNLDPENDPKNWLIKKNNSSKGYRLPTEAEWEYAAKGGINQDTFLYSGSNSIDSVAWYKTNARGIVQPVSTLLPNRLGIYDMTGNVWEWCWDWKYEEEDEKGNWTDQNEYYRKFENVTAINPEGHESGIRRVIRGTNMNSILNSVRITQRSRWNPHLAVQTIGFRCVKGM